MSAEERDINAQTLHKQEQLEYLLGAGRQHEYERELEYIRNRRRHAARQKRERAAERNYAEAVERIEQSDYDPSFDED